ncbi:MAG: NAD(P)/FAD-dependent oxidoreductase [Pasteurellaceae bacterium]|nr:NAD(P)/FAD-dependent oxidoreductase [Pasteurellaceae bacterium]
MTNYSEVIILGAGASGLFCASQSAKLGKQVCLFDHGKKIGRKILMSGGGFCNFTNLDVTAQHYLSGNPHFVKSALARFTQWDFIALVAQYGIAYHEKELGQLFCDDGAEQIVAMLRQECDKYGVSIYLRQNIEQVEWLASPKNVTQKRPRFQLKINGQQWYCGQLVIATGGLSMPALGATPFGYQIAEQFGHNILPPRASLVPLTYLESDKYYSELSGISLLANVKSQTGQQFCNQLLFTHRGISGPAILQISNYWQPNQMIEIDLLPNLAISEHIQQQRQSSPKLQLKTVLTRLLPKKLVELWIEKNLIVDDSLANLSNVKLQHIAQLIHQWQFQPNGTEGYRTAEVTMGGVDCDQISSKTMQSLHCPDLYFIGEVLDVTGWLGGYNFQWAWSSAYACAQALPQAK